MGVCTKERKGETAAVLMATPCTNSLGGESGEQKHESEAQRGNDGCVLLKRTKAESEAQRGKPKGALESESRNAIV